MNSRNFSDLLDLGGDTPTTNEDILALRRAEAMTGMDLESYIKFLSVLRHPTRSELQLRKGPVGEVPFEL